MAGDGGRRVGAAERSEAGKKGGSETADGKKGGREAGRSKGRSAPLTKLTSIRCNSSDFKTVLY